MGDKTTIGRLRDRGIGDRDAINAILDEGLVCHIGYVSNERPVVIPTLYARDRDRILLHGSNSAGMMRAVRAGSPLCVTVTHLDGIVVARSGMHSSANYRSVVIHGKGRLLEGTDRNEALDVIVDALIPGRVGDIRPPTESEIKQTSVFEINLDEVSAKVRTGGPQDDPEDIDSDVWAGVVPLRLVAADPEPSSDLHEGIRPPDYLLPYRR